MSVVRRRRLLLLPLAAALLGLAGTALEPAFSTTALGGEPSPAVPVELPVQAAPGRQAVPSRRRAATGARHRYLAPVPGTGRRAAEGSVTALVRAGAELAVHARLGGAVVAHLGHLTEFGSPQTLAVVERRGSWLGVVTEALPNGKVGWVRVDRGRLLLGRTTLRITVDLSSRLLTLRDGGRVLRRFSVGIGNPSSPTPVGKFAVSDKLAGNAYGPYYGCCILALTAHQPNLPPGWTGGDRMAIHGTSDPTSIGAARSAGCLRAADDDLRVLMRRVPLGTPVVIRP